MSDTQRLWPKDTSGDLERVERKELKKRVHDMLLTLTPREEKVLKMRFGIDDWSDHTLEEVGQSLALNAERIRQIEAKALKKLWHPSRSRRLRGFLYK